VLDLSALSSAVLATISGTLRRALPALGVYYAVALGIPIMDEKELQRALLAEHAFFVLVVPLLLLSLLGAFQASMQVALAHFRTKPTATVSH
jgi:hypothetical protein